MVKLFKYFIITIDPTILFLRLNFYKNVEFTLSLQLINSRLIVVSYDVVEA
ncbi:hypothetical protein [Gracilibacillus saliphilus]|uniref:hypothetical protein n=1 Tax=Gracilibacillus saliphilus TaxID=543890 RepID=UPI001EE16A5A|nr:hypothetical protein [Gracilibacillus saliphilus]